MKGKKKPKFSIGISQFFQLPFNVKLAKNLPFSVLRMYLYTLGFLYSVIARKQTIKIGRCLNYIIKPSLQHPSRYVKCLKAYCGIFEHYYEKLLLAYKPLDIMSHYLSERLYPSFPTAFRKCIDNRQGCILVTGHFGAVEFLPLASGILKIKIAMIVRFKTKKLRESLLKKAKFYDVLVIDADQPDVIKKAMQALKDGRVLITECDEFSKWHPNKKSKLSVFGHLMPVDRTLDFFYKRAKVPAFLGLVKRAKGKYELIVETLADGDPKFSLAKRSWKSLENHILLDPHQWYQWKSAYALLEEYIVQAQSKEKTVMGGIKPIVHHSAH